MNLPMKSSKQGSQSLNMVRNGGAAGPVAYNDLEIKQDLRRNNEWGGKVRKHCWQGKKNILCIAYVSCQRKFVGGRWR